MHNQSPAFVDEAFEWQWVDWNVKQYKDHPEYY